MSTPFPTEETAFAISRVAAPVREQVEALVRQAILSGRFRPGERLVERELCTLLGVSRTSLREALRQLEGDGLVVNIPNKGIVVATMTSAEAEEIYPVRAVLEGLVGRLFAERATSEQQAALQEALREVETVLQSGSLPALVAAKDHFYAILIDGCRNRTAMTVLQSLHDRIASLRFVTLAQPGRAEASVVEMRRILEAVLARDPEQARQACIDHVEHAAMIAIQVFDQQKTPSLSPDDAIRRKNGTERGRE
jgi:GntR family transcriptional regulator, trigonelline degradation regulator